MSGHSSRLSADLRWVEAMIADLQRQIDELTDELRALSHLVHVHTLASLRPPDTDRTDPPPTSQEADDAQ